METFLSGEVSATAVENLKKVELVEIVKHLSAETEAEALKSTSDGNSDSVVNCKRVVKGCCKKTRNVTNGV